MIAPETVFPLLKSAAWAKTYSTDGAVTLAVYDVQEVGDRAPVLTLCVDQGDTVAFVQEEDLPKGTSTGYMKLSAMRNLEYALADTGWEEIDMGEFVPGLRVLLLTGNYYAGEALLLPHRLMQAHKWLASSRLLASVPVRGRLLVAVADNPYGEQAAVFVAGCLSEFYGATGETPVSPLVWLVENGEIIGHLDVPADLEEGIARESLKQQEESLAKVKVKAYSFREPDGTSYRFVFRADDWDLLGDSVQSVLRDFVSQHNGDETLSGRVAVSIVLDPSMQAESKALEQEIKDILAYLSRQFSGSGICPGPGKKFRFELKLEASSSAATSSGVADMQA